LLSQSTWGFVFADPFSTELDITRLAEMLRGYAAYKDILVFANEQTISRQLARGHANDITRLCTALGISRDNVGEAAQAREPNVAALKRIFSPLKQFTIGVAIPVTVARRLINADYFYLILATDSIVVADCFLAEYAKVIAKKRKLHSYPPLFWGDEILNALRQNDQPAMTLREVMEYLWENFLSWKEAMRHPDYEVPTIEIVVNKLNSLRDRGQIEYRGSGDFQYKRTTTGQGGESPGHLQGDLAYSKIKKGRDTEQIRVALKE